MRVYSKTDVGMRREVNQDAYLTGELANGGIFAVVCDGMGGANAGHIASEKTAKLIFDYVMKSFSPKMSSIAIENMLRAAVSTANTEIWELSRQNEDCFGMGTTVVAVIVIDNLAHIVHVGDSRAYLIGTSSAEKLTVDHSMVQTMVNKGEITEDEAKTHPKKNIITRAVGVDEDILCDYNIVLKTEQAALLICTDGLSNQVDEEAIFNIVSKEAPDEAVNKLIEQANNNGGPDNITAVLIY